MTLVNINSEVLHNTFGNIVYTNNSIRNRLGRQLTQKSLI